MGEVANGALAELARYFGVRDANATSRPGDPKEPPGLTILCQLSELLVGFLRTCEEVRESPEDWIQFWLRAQIVTELQPHVANMGCCKYLESGCWKCMDGVLWA